ncbi:Multiple C2 and transmembrane domain-containing protein 1 [Saguinus oedipus]|uniref:Multiple C2 and transmembrane domain-containing protein 1 n=1 Tax=Saguinus oedipus TaxID=9490 RepID=A0ABQ9W914_SAGOE|nr:Multiple C2 and transmembrane domain-containing protein 1 [Saguinus oedipus]
MQIRMSWHKVEGQYIMSRRGWIPQRLCFRSRMFIVRSLGGLHFGGMCYQFLSSRLADNIHPRRAAGQLFLSWASAEQSFRVLIAKMHNTVKETNFTLLTEDAFQTQSLRLSDLHRKSHLWRGIVSITLIEGRDLKAMDSNGLSDPYVKFRLGHQKYKSKKTRPIIIMPKTLNPQWREQFDFHLYEERGGIIDITAWDKDAGKRDDFIGRCQVDLSALSREQTHKLELQLEEGEGHLVLLVTLTASATVSISDLSVNSLEDQKEREEILKRYKLSDGKIGTSKKLSENKCCTDLGRDGIRRHGDKLSISSGPSEHLDAIGWGIASPSPLRIFHNLKDVGFLQVKVIRAEGLMAADNFKDMLCISVDKNSQALQLPPPGPHPQLAVSQTGDQTLLDGPAHDFDLLRSPAFPGEPFNS